MTEIAKPFVPNLRKRKNSDNSVFYDRVEKASKMSPLANVENLYKQLKNEWNKKNPNLEKCGEILSELKVGLTLLTFLPTSTDDLKPSLKEELQLARDVLEIGVQWSVASKNIPSFERYMSQLKCYYFDYKTHLPESKIKYQLLGLNLLFLLSQNRVAEFHTELELLPIEKLNDPFIKHPLSLEQYLIEGRYNKIFLAKGNVPAQSYNFFMDILLDTTRNEIAECLEKAYEKISLSDATRKLYLKNQQETYEVAKKRNWRMGRENFIYFTANGNNVIDTSKNEPIPSTELALQVIEYAKELEMIV